MLQQNDDWKPLPERHIVDALQTAGRESIRNTSLITREIAESIGKGKHVVVFYFDIVQFHDFEEKAGVHAAGRAIKLFKHVLDHELQAIYNGVVRILATESLWGDDYISIMETELDVPTLMLDNMSHAYRNHIREAMNGEFIRTIGRGMDVHVGYSVIKDLSQDIEIQLYKATKKAYGIAKGLIASNDSHELLREFKEILKNKQLHSLYQPIVSICSAAILGWEALIRGPEKSQFQPPDVLFSFAEKERLLSLLEKNCYETALLNIGELGLDQKIFINLHPHTIKDIHLAEQDVYLVLDRLNLKPHNIVVEVTERHRVDDFISLSKILERYREQGFLVAVDDAGSGFSSLQSIAELQPDFIKVDMSLVRGIHKDRVKHTLMETFVAFAEKMGCKIIAEGIEEEEELTALVNIGVHYGQGFFLGRPSFPKQVTPEEIYLKTIHMANKGRHNILKRPFPIGHISQKAITVYQQMPIKDVKSLFDSDTSITGIVVVNGDKPLGLVMRQHLDRYLGKRFGVALYYEKPVAKIMDNSPLIVEDNNPTELVAQAAMNRNKIKLYDNIIVVSEGRLQGTVSVQTLLDTMTKIRVEFAKGANPLTGLPGNIAIEQEYYDLTKGNQPFSIILVDLDFFKSYNDRYGFGKGDDVILYTAHLLKDIVDQFGGENGFVGHVGGDDFIILTTHDQVDLLCQNIITRFDAGIVEFYSPEDRQMGRIVSRDRSGMEASFPIVSISLAALDCTTGRVKDMKEISEKMAKLKQYAKSKPGSVYVRDRRK